MDLSPGDLNVGVCVIDPFACLSKELEDALVGASKCEAELQRVASIWFSLADMLLLAPSSCD